jgi:heptosyltransferase-2
MNILIIKIGALGDVLRTSYIAQALKDKYRKRDPKIFWITDKGARHLFENSPYVDHIINSEEKEKVRKLSFDLIINLEEDKDNCKFASLLKYKQMIGFVLKEGKIMPTETAKEWFDMSALGKKPQNDILKKKE